MQRRGKRKKCATTFFFIVVHFQIVLCVYFLTGSFFLRRNVFFLFLFLRCNFDCNLRFIKLNYLVFIHDINKTTKLLYYIKNKKNKKTRTKIDNNLVILGANKKKRRKVHLVTQFSVSFSRLHFTFFQYQKKRNYIILHLKTKERLLKKKKSSMQVL